MPDVRAEDRVEPGAHRVRAAVEGPPIDGVVGLATEIEARDEEVADVLLVLDLASEVVVEILDAARQRRVRVPLQPLPPAHRLRHGLATVLLRVLEQLGAVQLARIRALDRAPVALLPVPDEIRIEHAGPADPALEESEVQVREATGHPAEEERLADGMAGGGEMADVVIAEIGRGVAQEDRPRAVVEARRDLELSALGPHGIIVVVAVDPDHVVP